MFQSTHPRGVRRMQMSKVKLPKIVSIHAPTRGATDNHKDELRQVMVSIHAPTRGATISENTSRVCEKFQSTHPRGVRLVGASSLW